MAEVPTQAAIQAAFPVPINDLPGAISPISARKLFFERLRRSRRREARLLWEHLSPMQKQEAERTGYIPVVGSKGGHWLVQLYPQTMHMWKLNMDASRSSRHRCLIFPGDEAMPPLDWVVSKVLLLEADEAVVDLTAY